MYVPFTADLNIFLYNLRHFFSLADYVDGRWSHTVTKTQGVTYGKSCKIPESLVSVLFHFCFL